MIDWDKHVLAPTIKVFGEAPENPIVYYPKSGGSFNISGVFDRAYAHSIPLEDGTFGVTTTSPVLGVRSAEFEVEPKQGDQVFVSSVDTRYIVREPQADGHGWVKLLLNKVAP